MSAHLDEVALEALATDRDDLVSDAQLAHVDECAACAARVDDERRSAEDASLALRRAMPAFDELDAMVARAMQKAPIEGPLAADVGDGVAPSRRSLWIGAGVGGALAAMLAVLSAPGFASLAGGFGSWRGLGTAGGQVVTLARAADRVVETTMPAGWIGVALAGLCLVLMLALPMRWLMRDGHGAAWVSGMLAALLLSVVALPTAHAYRVEGAWPEPQPTVVVDVEDQPTTEALRQAAESAGLGVVVRLDEDPRVTMHVRGAPIGEVVEALLGERAVIVRPGPSLITVRPDPEAAGSTGSASAPSEPASPSVAPEALAARPPSPRGTEPPPSVPPVPSPPARPSLAIPVAPDAGVGLGDRVTLGSDTEIAADERVRSVYTMGGDARVLGHAYGDVVTMGGDADVSGEVVGNVMTMGGDITVGPTARIHGDLNAMGGEIVLAETAVLHGGVIGMDEAHGPGVHLAMDDPKSDEGGGFFRWALWNALLFLFGLLMLGASRERFQTLRGELAARPVRSAFGGLVGLLIGGALTVLFTLTVIGIPGAVVIALLLACGYVVGWGTSAWWLGSVLPIPALANRPVLQLAVGTAVLFAVGLIPKIGTLLVIAAALAGLGAVIVTSFGANARRKKAPRHVPTGPFRSASR